MSPQKFAADYDSHVSITDYSMVEELGDRALLGNWFVFLKGDWLKHSGMAWLLESSSAGETFGRSTIAFRGKEAITLPALRIAPTPLPTIRLISLTCDKVLYRANRDTVRLLIAVPQSPQAELRLELRLSGNSYADYPVTLDEYGLCLWSMQGLPEGEYEATLEGVEAESCRFEVAEYRLAPLNAELAEQQLSGETLRYVLSVTTFGRPYSGPLEVELQERGQRVGQRFQLICNHEGQCRGAVKLAGQGPYTLNVFAGERSATIALKGSEQDQRETLVISELGEVRELSLLPLPQSASCRGLYIARGGVNTEPFLVRRVISSEVEITPRVDAEQLRVVVVDPTRNTFEEKLYTDLKAQHSVRQPIPAPYGIVLLGAFVDGKAWEGWCSVLRPSVLQLQCETPREAKPGARITVTLKTNFGDRVVPVQLIVKDQRLVAASDPQVEFAACIKRNLGEWQKATGTGEVDRQIAHLTRNRLYYERRITGLAGPRPMAVFPQPFIDGPLMAASASLTQSDQPEVMYRRMNEAVATLTKSTPRVTTTAALTKMRLQFPEIIYNNIVKVQGQASVEVTLGDSLTRYSIEAFALAPETLDWQRVETTLEAVQSVYGELTVSPFVFPGDSVMGRLDVGAASGGAIVEVRHDGETLPLFFNNGEAITPGLPIPTGSVLRFPLRPGAITSTVRDARKGGIDVSERYVTAPGKLRHIARRLRLLTSGDEATLQEPHCLEIKPMPGLEKPFQFFVESAARYPFGCIEQTSLKILAMYTGYISDQDNEELAREYEAVIPSWHKRLKSMYLPNSGFCMYPPEEGGARKADTHYAPLGVKHLLSLPGAERAGIKQKTLQGLLKDIHAMARDAAAYYKIDYPPKEIKNCQDAYLVLANASSQSEKDQAAAFVRSRLAEHNGRMYVEVPADRPSSRLWGMAVSTREETAYAAASLLTTKNQGDLPLAVAATNYVTSQLNEEGRLYSTVDTAAGLALMIGLRDSGVVTTAGAGRVLLNGQEMPLADALKYDGKVQSLRCVAGVIAAQVTSEVIEDWSTLKSQLPVTVRLEQHGHVQKRFKAGDALDLVISVPRYEPGLIAHVCLPDALARVVGGSQVKRFSLDFCEQNTLRIPLAVVASTSLPGTKDTEAESSVQHWAVIVRNMFKEEQVGNPGLLEVIVE